MLADFDSFFADTVAVVVALTREVVDRATELRAAYNVKTPNALHLAAALVSRCETFLPNDNRLSRVPDITVEVVSLPGPVPPDL